MRRALLALLVVGIVAAPVLAGQNPDIRAYIDFDPPNYVHSSDPTAFTQATSYLCLDYFGGLDTGMTAMSFKMNVTGGSLVTTYASLLPGGLSIGGWETGITLSATECVYPDGTVVDPPVYGIVQVATITLFANGDPGDILIEDHPDFPRWVVDCGAPVPETDFYCVLYHGAVYKAAIEGDCPPVSPVEDSSWGSIKALYR